MDQRGLVASPTVPLASVAALNGGHHVALVGTSETSDDAVAFGELLCDCATAAGLCLGWLCLHGTAGALLRLDELIRARFLSEVWVLLANPSAKAIARAVNEIREQPRDASWRLVVATSSSVLRTAELSPAERRLLIPVAL
jgi:hypothetical protein